MGTTALVLFVLALVAETALLVVQLKGLAGDHQVCAVDGAARSPSSDPIGR